MREIKFRGFHADEHGKTVIKLNGKEIRGKWFYGDLHTDGGYYINEHSVLPETVGQYVCNDKNGKEVFEGDILKITWKTTGKKPVFKNFVVVYSRGTFFCRQFGSDKLAGSVGNYISTTENDRASVDVEVVGNIYDNPELLEVEG